MQQLSSSEKQYITIPSNWKKRQIDGRYLPVRGIATYYLQIILSNPNQETSHLYGIILGNITSAYSLYVNNNPVAQAGNATQTEKGFEASYLPQTCYFYSKSDTLDVILHVSNYFDSSYAGISQKIYFGKQDAIARRTFFIYACSIFMLSAFLLILVFQLILYFAHKEKFHLMIALLAAIAFLKMLLDGNIVIFHFFPRANFIICYHFWLLSFLAIPIIFKLTHITFPSEMNGFIEKTTIWVYGIFAIVFLLADIHFILRYLVVVIALSFLYVLYLSYVLLKAVIKGRRYSYITGISFIIMLLSITNDLLYVFNQTTYPFLSQLGIVIYVMSQTVIISLKFAHSQKKIVSLSQELELANSNLEAKVTVRTRELYEANLELAKVNRQKDLLISTITHDLMGCFNTLLTFSSFLSKDIQLPEKQRKRLLSIRQASEKGYQILENILAWAKLQILNKPESDVITDLSRLIKNNVELESEQLEAKSLSVSIDVDDSLYFQCDESNLNTIFRNLLSNGIKFSLQGGIITFVNRVENNFVKIIVHDNGIGMPPDIVATIFEMDKTKKRPGTLGERGSGLGLMIVQELVESNNGHIACYSVVNKETNFILEFPLINKSQI